MEKKKKRYKRTAEGDSMLSIGHIDLQAESSGKLNADEDKSEVPIVESKRVDSSLPDGFWAAAITTHLIRIDNTESKTSIQLSTKNANK